MAMFLVACGAMVPTPVSREVALKELPAPEEVAFIEIMNGANTPLVRIEDPKIIAAAIEFLRELDGWSAPTDRAISVEGVFAAFVRKSNVDPCAFFVDPDLIVVSGTHSGGELHADSATVRRFKTILFGVNGN